MLVVDPRIVSFCKMVTHRYVAEAASAHPGSQPVVTKFKQLAVKLTPYVGKLVSTLDGQGAGQISLDTQMGDYRRLVVAQSITLEDPRLADLSNILQYYDIRIATILSKLAAADSEIIDYLDVVKWGDSFALA